MVSVVSWALARLIQKMAGVPPLMCRCGHSFGHHDHHRPGTDCGRCGSQVCERFTLASLDRP
jgi:ArsR family metal-binding transcriptional regulator